MGKNEAVIKLVSLFSGAGGLDTGFEIAFKKSDSVSFQTVWANEYDKAIHATYRAAFPQVNLVQDSITKVVREDLKDLKGHDLVAASEKGTSQFGLLGGPPCQSWSAAGSKRGKEDPRGQLFWDYIRILKMLKPVFFVAENVPGILADRNREALDGILEEFCEAGYNVRYSKLNAAFHDVPEDRERVIFVGFRTDLVSKNPFEFPKPSKRENGTLRKMTMADVPRLKELAKTAKAFDPNDRDSKENEFMEGGFSSMYLSRNRCRKWDEPSFTIQATARHAPVHPDFGSMTKQSQDLFDFDTPNKARRFTVRECAEIQTFPASHKFIYKNIVDGYKMIGNAVPVNLAKAIAREIGNFLNSADYSNSAPANLKKGRAEYIKKPY